MDSFVELVARAALGIGNRTLADAVSQTAFAGTVGLTDAEPIAINVTLVSIVVGVLCSIFIARRGR